MKLLLVSEDLPHPHAGGLARHVLALAQALHAQGHQVDLLGNDSHQPTAEQRGPGRFIAGIHGAERGWGQTRLGVIPPWGLRWRARAVARAIGRHAAGYDLVHYHGHLPWLTRWLPPGLRFTQTRHDQGGDCMRATRVRPDGSRCVSHDPRDCAACATPAPGALQRAVSAQAVRWMRQATADAARTHGLVVVADMLRDGLQRLGAPAERITWIANAADRAPLQRAVDEAPRSLPAAPGVHLLVAAALFDYKGVGPLLDHLMAAPGLPPGWRLTVAGDGPLRAALQARWAGPAVHFAGWCSHAQTLQLMLASQAVLLPSLCDEPCSTVVLEALALGRPVYALRRGGTPALAALAGPGAGPLLQLFDDLPQLAAGLRQGPVAARPARQALADFQADTQALAQQLLQHYRQVLA